MSGFPAALYHPSTRTQRLDVILVEASLDILDHETGLADLRVTDHADLDDDAAGPHAQTSDCASRAATRVPVLLVVTFGEGVLAAAPSAIGRGQGH